ncbi:transcriptional regulator, BadM/Rrf2 family [Geoalkalibacter ferrihydriticus]|uniref:Rrf2 family transcriptional regulator n=2 Tax=Geoalkalibacter ferrihydriticus TaxID=392333 RepID=A0A0C2HT93_9BACT|nr:Rrf2 family transcriptional regulator [Geoalkalibacter ferrihydriticus]KIH78030.1 Rrf2 family transcriptional regulator [Geoalkalibacter ferrihydriticus DSM 17813]SDM32409.1 transcriptional regulator, BadM/Rrf2 family [Geoalkalibacter ferrihydriticus]
MKLSTKSRYGVRALFDMAYHAGTLPVQIKDISRRQQISPRYLEQIFQDLKKAGLLKSRRGPQGGYFLSRKPEEITAKEIILAAEGDLSLVNCIREGQKDCQAGCEFDNVCVTQQLWQEATRLLHEYFGSVTLKDLCDRGKELGLEKELDHRFMYFI